MPGVQRYCSKCGYFGPAAECGTHPRPRDGSMCGYAAVEARPVPADISTFMSPEIDWINDPAFTFAFAELTEEKPMTTRVTIDAHAGWPVSVVTCTTYPGGPPTFTTEIVAPHTQRDFYIHSGLQIIDVRELPFPDVTQPVTEADPVAGD